ncbi:MAG: HIT family protein [Candidatus Aenigmatarchaeota archaeon]
MDNRHPDCKLCNPYSPIIKKLKFWTIILCDDQSVPGYCLIVHNGHIEDPMDTSEEERLELWDAMDKLHDALTELFQPDLFNYMFLGNEDRHVHMHVIPRYAVPRMWSGQRFDDHAWGASKWPGIRRELTPELMKKMRDEIAAAMH